MMKRSTLSRPFYISVLAIAGLIVLSYIPLTRLRAQSVGATILPSVKRPLANLKNPQNLKVTHTGSANVVAALQDGSANPTALAAADFDADGAMDVVAGYSTANGGLLVVHRGNPDAYAPKDTSLYQKAMQGSVPPTFLSKAAVLAVPESPDLMLTGDFNRDGNQDILVAARGGALYLLAGDGRGNFLPAQMVPVTGTVMAMAAAGDGHVAVSMDGGSGPQLAILAPGWNGFTAGAIHLLPARGDSVAWGSLGGGADLAVGAGANVVMIYNALSANPQTETVSVPFQVQALALGDFIWDRDGRTEISLLADDGSIHILQHGTLDTRPLTRADIAGRRTAWMARSKQSQDATSFGAWTVAKQLPFSVSASSGSVSPSAFSSPRVAASSTHDLLVLDAGRSQLNILDTSGKTASASASVSFSGTPVAALALPQKLNAERDIVVLTSAQSAPMLLTAGADPTFNVNTTADVDAIGACAINSTVTSDTGLPSLLSLREAVCEANNSGAATSVINLPAGTYALSISTFGGNGSASSSGELQVGMQAGNNISIVGAGVGSTTIRQTDNVNRIIEGDQLVAGNMPLSISNLTLTGGLCDTTGLDCALNGGGAIFAGGPGDNLTLTNVVMSNNAANPTATTTNQESGGALTYVGPTLIITGSTFSSNTASGAGGAIYAEDGFFSGFLAGSVSITNSNFTDNTNISSGGAIRFDLHGGYPATISGSTFTGNKTTGPTGNGGAITAETFDTTNGNASFTMSMSRISGNSAPGAGTGVAAVSVAATMVNNWWGCNAGPGGTGCDTISNDLSTVTFNPWLVLAISPSSSQIFPSGTSTLTADLTHNSSNTSGFSVPNGTPVTFGGTLGTVNPTSAGTGSPAAGQATSVYTAGATAGNDTDVTAKVDNQTVSTTISIQDTVTVTTNPSGLSITVDTVALTAPQTFHWNVGDPHSLSTTSPQAGPTGSQYVFGSWSDLGLQSHSVMAPSATTTYTADFNTQYQLTTQASPAPDGSVSPASGSYFAPGASIPVLATANPTFMFSSWSATSGSFDSTSSASTNFHMPSAAATVTGNFSVAIVGANTSTSVTSNNNPSFTAAPGNSVTFTATVTSTSTVNEGTVTFTDGGNPIPGGGAVAVSNGTAALTTSFTIEGNHDIKATYNGTVNFVTSNGSVSQEVDSHTVVTGNTFCNPGGITIPASGAAQPYPSRIFVSSLPTTLSTVTVTVDNFSHASPVNADMLLTGPTGANLVFWGDAGGTNPVSGLNVILDDAAGGFISNPVISGTFKPTAVNGSVLFPSPAPSSPIFAASAGSGTLASAFAGTNPNGTWSFYVVDTSGSSGGTIGQVCLNFTVISPVLSVSKSHSGSFTQGQTATWNFDVSNTASGTTTSGNVVLSDSFPAGYTLSSFSGTGWSCTGTTTANCLNSTAVAGGSSFPTLTLTVNVPPNSPVSVSNTALAAGGGALHNVNSNTDTVAVNQVAASITATGGGSQSTPVNTAFTNALQATVKDAGSNPVPNVSVTFTAPASGASGTFSNNTNTISVNTNSSGVASETFTANGTPGGPYTVTASVAGASTPADFSLTNSAQPVQITLQTSPPGLLVSADGGTAAAAPQTFTFNAGSQHTITTTSPQPGASGVQYVWSKWSDSGAISHLITVPTSAATYTATFNTQYQLTTAVSPAGSGSVSPASGSFYNSGTIVNLAATANAGFAFSSWTGNVANTHSASTTITMTAPQSVTANFAGSAPDLAITKAHLGNFAQGETGATYFLTVSNVGTGPTSGTVTVSDALPAGLSATHLSGSGWTCSLSPLQCHRNTVLANGHNYPVIVLTVNVAANAPSSVTNSATVSGGGESNTANDTANDPTNIATAGIAFSPTNISFGTVTLWGGTSQILTVTNKGQTIIKFNAIFLSSLQNAASQDFSIVGCVLPLLPNQNCKILLSLRPSKVGAVSAILNLQDNVTGSPQQINVTATVIAPKASLNSSSLDFGTHSVNSSTVKTVTLSNPGIGALTISGISVIGLNSGDFTETNNCGGSVAANTNCTISVTFKPKAKGSRFATLRISDNALLSPQTVSLSGRGN